MFKKCLGIYENFKINRIPRIRAMISGSLHGTGVLKYCSTPIAIAAEPLHSSHLNTVRLNPHGSTWASPFRQNPCLCARLFDAKRGTHELSYVTAHHQSPPDTAD